MALIVEDGTGKTDAESYISVEDATEYFAARGNTTWNGLASDTVREQLLRKATDYIGARYALQWSGARTTSTQALDWPRQYVPRADVATGRGSMPLYYDSDTVPAAVARACAELAVRAAAGELVADVGAQVKSETVGPISVTYADGARQQTRFEVVDQMLAPLLKGCGQVAVVRA